VRAIGRKLGRGSENGSGALSVSEGPLPRALVWHFRGLF
jgi:hypothetical protein